MITEPESAAMTAANKQRAREIVGSLLQIDKERQSVGAQGEEGGSILGDIPLFVFS